MSSYLWMETCSPVWSMARYKCGICMCCCFCLHCNTPPPWFMCKQEAASPQSFPSVSSMCFTIRASWGGEVDRGHWLILHAVGSQHIANPQRSPKPVTSPVNHSAFPQKRNVQLRTSATDFGILFPLPSAFCVKKFCLNNYLSVPFAHSQHNHSSTFCFQLVLISNGLLASICSQHHQSAQNYPETWRNLDKAEAHPSIQWSLLISPQCLPFLRKPEIGDGVETGFDIAHFGAKWHPWVLRVLCKVCEHSHCWISGVKKNCFKTRSQC